MHSMSRHENAASSMCALSEPNDPPPWSLSPFGELQKEKAVFLYGDPSGAASRVF